MFIPQSVPLWPLSLTDMELFLLRSLMASMLPFEWSHLPVHNALPGNSCSSFSHETLLFGHPYSVFPSNSLPLPDSLWMLHNILFSPSTHSVWLISSFPCLKYSPYETASSMYISGLHLSFVFQSFLFSIWFDIFTWMSHKRPKLACLILNSWFYLKIYSLTSLFSAKGKLRTWGNVLIFSSPSPTKPIHSFPIDSVWKLHVVSFSPIPRSPC